MSNPKDATHTEKGKLNLAYFLFKWAFKESVRAKSPKQFKSGGIAASEVHQGEAVITHKGLNFTLPNPPNFNAKAGAIKPTLSISESDLLKLKNLKK